MSGSHPDDRSSRPDDDGLDALGAHVAKTPDAAPPAASAGDDDKIDLNALMKLSSMAPRSPQDAAAPAQHIAFDVDAGFPRVSRRREAPAFLLPLVLGFAVGVPVGGLLFSGRDAPAAAPAPLAASAPAPVTPEAAPPELAAAPTAPAVPPPSAAAPIAPAAPVAQAPAATVQEPVPAARPTALPPSAAPVAVVAPAAPRPLQPSAAPSAPAPRPTAVAQPAPSSEPVVQVRKVEPAREVAVAPTPREVSEEPDALGLAEAKPARQGPRTMDNLLDDAIVGPRDPMLNSKAPAASTEVPQMPSREDVSNAMQTLLPAIRGCAMGQVGLATAVIVVQNDGKVASVNVTGSPFQGSASGRCMEGVVRRAKFPRFKQPSFRVQFPFSIQ